MLSCPYCQGALSEDSPHCPRCSLTLDGVNKLLGPVPLLNRGVTDTTQSLSPGEEKALTKTLKQFESRFANTQLNIILRDFSADCSLATHLFWLFNTAGLSAQERRNNQNRDLLLGLDPSKGKIAIMVGYGLEPFLKQSELNQLIESARPHLEAGNFSKAIIQIIGGLQILLQQIPEEFAKAFGLDEGASSGREPIY